MCNFPIVIEGTKISVPSMDVREAHSLFRCAILDGEVPITMPIGFSLVTPRSSSFISAIDRNACCQESVIAVATNVSNILLVGDMDRVVDIEEQKGVVTTGNARWRSHGRYGCEPVDKAQYMFTATAPMSIRFVVHKATGYRSMAENAKVINDDTYFPLNTAHTLIDYVRVLPLTSGSIEVRYINGMTSQMFQAIWDSAWKGVS